MSEQLDRVPDAIKLAIKAWPECKDIGLKKHYAARDGLCYTCGVIAPCEFEQWLHTIPDPRPAYLPPPKQVDK